MNHQIIVDLHGWVIHGKLELLYDLSVEKGYLQHDVAREQAIEIAMELSCRNLFGLLEQTALFRNTFTWILYGLDENTQEAG